MYLEQLNIKITFFYGNIHTTTRRFYRLSEQNQVCLLKKSLYVLKRSPNQWYKKFDSYIIENGFYSCVYYN